MTNSKKTRSGKAPPAKRSITTVTVVKGAKGAASPQPMRNTKSSVPRGLIHAVCGLTDPFCNHAAGAKYPDSSRVRTLTYPYRAVLTFSTNASGRVAALFMPDYFRDALTEMQDVSPNTATWKPAGIAPVITSVTGYRIVSCGLRIRRIIAPLNAGGTVHIRVLGAQAALGSSDVDVLSYARSECIDVALQDCKETVVSGTRSAQMPQNFYSADDPGTNPLLWTLAGFQPITVFVDGAPALTPVITIEYILNYELTFDDDSATALLTTPPPPANEMVVGATARVSSIGRSIFTAGADALGRYVVGAATAAIGSYFGPAALVGRTAAMMIRDVD